MPLSRLDFRRTTLRKIILLIAGLAAATLVSGCMHEGGGVDASAFSAPADRAPEDPPPAANHYGDTYGRRCLPEEDGHMGRFTCEYRD
jgi:hypothetical protein